MTFEERVLPHYETYVKLATKWCYGDRHKAEDMVQEAMMKAFVHYGEFDEKYKIATWFHQILRNTVMDAFKSDERAKAKYYDYWVWKGQHDPFYSMDLSEEEEFDAEAMEKLPRLIGALPPLDQTIITMYMAGELHQEIGKTLGLTRGNVTYRIRKICKKLREDLANKTC